MWHTRNYKNHFSDLQDTFQTIFTNLQNDVTFQLLFQLLRISFFQSNFAPRNYLLFCYIMLIIDDLNVNYILRYKIAQLI